MSAGRRPLTGSDGADRQLLDDDGLHASAVVANCSMNRERQLAGVNRRRNLVVNVYVTELDS